LDLDCGFIVKLVESGNFDAARRAGITPGMLSKDYSRVYQFIIDTYRTHRVVPSFQAIQAFTGVNCSGSFTENLDFFIDAILRRRLHYQLTEVAQDIARALREHNPNLALDLLEGKLRRIREERLGQQKTENLLSIGNDVLTYYDKVKNGIRGISSPWPTMDRWTLGWWPEDVAVFVSRLGIGKTTALILCMRQAWIEGKRALFISTEMNRIKIAMRFYAVHLAVNYQDLRSGRLGDVVEPRFRAHVNELMEQDGLYIIGGSCNVDIQAVELAIEECNPDIVLVDGLYLVQSWGDDRRERVSNTIEEVKRLARRTGLPFITSSQFNREVRSNTTRATAENIGITDIIGWTADWVFGLLQTDAMKQEERMMIKPLKLRESDGREFEVNWSYSRGDFSEKIEFSEDREYQEQSQPNISSVPDEEVPF